MPKVFVSYSSRNKKFVVRLIDILKKNGIALWFDQWEIKVGDSIAEKIDVGIRSSDYLLIVLSKASASSRWVREELSAAKTIEIEKRGVFILPALLEDCDVPPLIASKRYADFRHSFNTGVYDLLRVFGITSSNVSEVKRYRLLESRWKEMLRKLERQISNIVRLKPSNRKNEYHLTDAYSDDKRQKLLNDIHNALDVYKALRPLEKVERLSEILDGEAYFLAILAKAHDLQMFILQNRYPRLTDVGLGVYLLIGCTQAVCGIREESIWTFRQAIRIAIALCDSVEDALLPVTYQLARRIAFLDVGDEENVVHDFVINLLVCDKKDYLQHRTDIVLDSYREAIRRELPWRIDTLPVDRANYACLMEAAGFWREALPFMDAAHKDFPDDGNIRENLKLMKPAVSMMESSGTGEVSGQAIHQLPTFLCEFGSRERFDEMIRKHEPEFWEDVVIGIDEIIGEQLLHRLFPSD